MKFPNVNPEPTIQNLCENVASNPDPDSGNTKKAVDPDLWS